MQVAFFLFGELPEFLSFFFFFYDKKKRWGWGEVSRNGSKAKR
jgi:hypothetical protein